jgi:hypothetical protein
MSKGLRSTPLDAALLQQPPLDVRLEEGAHDEEGHAEAARLRGAHELEARQSGHGHVGEHQGRQRGGEPRQRFVAVQHDLDREILAPQHGGHQAPDRRVIVHDEHAATGHRQVLRLSHLPAPASRVPQAAAIRSRPPAPEAPPCASEPSPSTPASGRTPPPARS